MSAPHNPQLHQTVRVPLVNCTPIYGMKRLGRHHRFLNFSIALAFVGGCDDGYLRGKVSPSADGKTYLAVIDDNGGACGAILVDAEPWPHAIGERGEVRPGLHTIECGKEISFEIPAGVVFEFDYWGP